MEQKKILVVDDEPSMVAAVKAALRSKSYNVITACDGEEGLSKVTEEKPDLIILDVIMPGKHGFQVCRELKADPKYESFSKIPVLMLTVYPDDRKRMHLSMLEGMNMEAEDYIQKPFDPDELLDRVERLLKVTSGVN
jgi:DNA-binding response OmpR family regulator